MILPPFAGVLGSWTGAAPDSARGARRRPARLVGNDLARTRFRAGRGRRLAVPAILTFLAAGLALAALRVDGIRVRYALAAAMEEERELLEMQRERVAAVQRLRDPSRLSALAAEMGLARPERVIDRARDTAGVALP